MSPFKRAVVGSTLLLGSCSDGNQPSPASSTSDSTTAVGSTQAVTSGSTTSGASSGGASTTSTSPSTETTSAGGASSSTFTTGSQNTAAGGSSGGSTATESGGTSDASVSTEATAATSSGGAVGAGGATVTSGDAGTGGNGTGGGTGGGTVAFCPDGIVDTLTVGPSGADFTSVQAAVDSIANGSNTPTRIDIQAGTYTEKITISDRTHLCLVGDDPSTTILSFADASATIGSTSGSASVHVDADDFSAANLTIENGYGTGSQAVALRATGQRQQFYNCRFVGYQDTLYTHGGSQYFKNCYVQGNTDYVFGGATAVLENCEVRNVEGGSAVTAPSTDLASAFGIVFLGGTFSAEGSVGQSSVALGRPWGADGMSAFFNVELGSHIASEGFVVMGDNDPQNARFGEYQSTGPGANAGARPSYQLSAGEAANYTLEQIFPNWSPSYRQLE